MADEVNLDEQFESLERRFGSWDGYKTQYFVRLGPSDRQIELSIFDHALEPKPLKGFAEHWTRYRELQALDSLMTKAGR
jgi:hypothetical protein